MNKKWFRVYFEYKLWIFFAPLLALIRSLAHPLWKINKKLTAVRAMREAVKRKFFFASSNGFLLLFRQLKPRLRSLELFIRRLIFSTHISPLDMKYEWASSQHGYAWAESGERKGGRRIRRACSLMNAHVSEHKKKASTLEERSFTSFPLADEDTEIAC
jgi:hypothetical protein